MNTHYKVACFGEVLWDILPTGTKLGGAPFNVSYHLNTLGTPAVMISRIGSDALGKKILQEATARNLSTNYIQTDALRPTSTVNAVPGANNEMSYVFTPNIAWDNIQWEPALQDLVSGCAYFVFGSLAARGEATRQTLHRLLDVAQQKVFDVNLRAPHYTQGVVEDLLHRADVVKMNEHELQLLGNWFTDAHREEETIRLLCNKFNIATLLVTLGAEGALLYTDQKFHRQPGYPVVVADTVGSGDAFLAAYLHETINEKSAAAALDFACRLGAFIAGKEGGTPGYRVEEIRLGT